MPGMPRPREPGSRVHPNTPGMPEYTQEHPGVAVFLAAVVAMATAMPKTLLGVGFGALEGGSVEPEI